VIADSKFGVCRPVERFPAHASGLVDDIARQAAWLDRPSIIVCMAFHASHTGPSDPLYGGPPNSFPLYSSR